MSGNSLERPRALGLILGTVSAGAIFAYCLALAQQRHRVLRARRRLCELLTAVTQEDARIVIAGANTGIGQELGRLLGEHASVSLLLGCRGEDRSENGRVKVQPLDLLNFDSVQHFAQDAHEFLASGGEGLRLLVNNAAIKDSEGGLTKYGVSPMWQTNFLSPFLLTELIARKRETASTAQPLRVVNVASGHENESQLDEALLDAISGGQLSPHEYADSKRALLLWTSVRAQSLAFKSNIFVHASTPGKVDTQLGLYHIPKWLWALTKPYRVLRYKSTGEGALAVVAAGLRPHATHKFGHYLTEDEVLEDLVIWRMPEKKLAVRLVKWATQVTALEARSGGRPLSETGRPLSLTDLASMVPTEEDHWSSAERRWSHSEILEADNLHPAASSTSFWNKISLYFWK